MPDAVRMLVQEMIELDAAEAIGAARYERSDTRVTNVTITGLGCCRRRLVTST